MKHNDIIIVPSSEDYQLLDSGSGMKLERFGDVVLARPDPQVLWDKHAPESLWLKAHASYKRSGKQGEWYIAPGTPESWPIHYGDLSIVIKPTTFKHTGLFPEQRAHWDWSRSLIKKAGRQIKVLNLFGYTGAASLAAAQAGAQVTHVDASKVAVAWAKENALHSKLQEAPIRWIIDDVFAFVRREMKRGNTYDMIIMDPPAFGRGPKGELWKIEEGFTTLIHDVEQLLSQTPLGIMVSGYAAGYSHLSFQNVLGYVKKKRGGMLESGEIALEEVGSKRLLSCGIFARWIS
ncbi:MAG: hypothetical protein RI911_277 [Candidatus Parcubacteria bacterium]|jgi:23S rRNA (cytosine1962-C5)-methyltransferase